MTGVTAQATGHEEIMFFLTDNSFAAHLFEVFFTHICQASTYLPSVKGKQKRKENS